MGSLAKAIRHISGVLGIESCVSLCHGGASDWALGCVLTCGLDVFLAMMFETGVAAVCKT